MPTEKQVQIAQAFEARRLAALEAERQYLEVDMWAETDKARTFDPATGGYVDIHGPVPASVVEREESAREAKSLATLLLGMAAFAAGVVAVATLASGNGDANLGLFAMWCALAVASLLALGLVNHEIGKQLAVALALAGVAVAVHGAYERHQDKNAQRIADAIRE